MMAGGVVTGDVMVELALQISEPAPPVATVAPATPRRLAQVVDRCLAKDPAARFQRGESVADAIALAVINGGSRYAMQVVPGLVLTIMAAWLGWLLAR